MNTLAEAEASWLEEVVTTYSILKITTALVWLLLVVDVYLSQLNGVLI